MLEGGIHMQFIPTKVHGILDYLLGVLLIAAPWLLGFAAGGAETWVPVVLGAGIIVYSLMTRYELGAMPAIGMRTHLWLDGIGGAFLAVSPWLFGFADVIWWPHVLFGVLEILVAVMTHKRPEQVAAPTARRTERPAER